MFIQSLETVYSDKSAKCNHTYTIKSGVRVNKFFWKGITLATNTRIIINKYLYVA